MKSVNAPRLPDCFQKTPKKVTLSENGQILAVAVDSEGLLQLKPFYVFTNRDASKKFLEVSH